MKIIVCGGRDYGHIVRTKAKLEDEPEEVLHRAAEYGYIHTVLQKAVEAYSTERNENDNWLPFDITIIEGGATGADSAAGDFALTNWCPLLVFKADWQKHGRKAGYLRNKQMLEATNPDLVIAFPGGKGTAMMVALAGASDVKVIECDGKTIPTFKPITEN